MRCWLIGNLWPILIPINGDNILAKFQLGMWFLIWFRWTLGPMLLPYIVEANVVTMIMVLALSNAKSVRIRSFEDIIASRSFLSSLSLLKISLWLDVHTKIIKYSELDKLGSSFWIFFHLFWGNIVINALQRT